MTDGSVLTHDWTEGQQCSAMFLISDDGTLSATALRNALIIINR